MFTENSHDLYHLPNHQNKCWQSTLLQTTDMLKQNHLWFYDPVLYRDSDGDLAQNPLGIGSENIMFYLKIHVLIP